LSRRRRGHHPRVMDVRDGRGARLRRALGRRSLAFVTLLYAAAALAATWPAIGSFGSAFMASGGNGYGEPPAGDHLQAVYRLWLVGHQLANGAAPWEDPYSFQPLAEPQTVLAGWPFGLLYWPLGALFGPVVAWNLLLLGTIVAAGLVTYLWLRALDLSPWAAAIGGLAFAVAPYRLDQSASGHLLGWASLFIPLALLGIERARVAGARLGSPDGRGARLDRALRPASPRARGYPVRARLRAHPPWPGRTLLDLGRRARRRCGRSRRPLHADRRVGRGPGPLAL